MDKTEKRFSVPLSLLNAITTYLGRQPWGDVAGMMSALGNPEIVIPIEQAATEDANEQE